MLKIGFITSSLSSEDGWGRYSKSLIESVSKSEDVSVITEKMGNDTSLTNIYPRLPHFGFDIGIQVKVFLNVLKYFRDCDVIHSLIEPFAPGAALASKLIGAKFIMTLHGTYSVPPSGFSMQGFLIKFALRSTRMTTTGSKYTEIKARERVKFGECIFIPNGVDNKVFFSNQKPRENFILSVGWLKSRKGADLLIKAFALIKDEFPGLRCKIAGGIGSENFYDYLKNLAKETETESRIDFLGRISDNDLVALYNTCKVFVFPARDIDGNFEGFPMVFYEANACGAPVITTKGFGSEYAIKDGYNGILVEPEDVNGIAKAIRSILSDEQLRGTMSQNSLEVAGRHTWDKIAQNYLMPFYNQALKK